MRASEKCDFDQIDIMIKFHVYSKFLQENLEYLYNLP